MNMEMTGGIGNIPGGLRNSEQVRLNHPDPLLQRQRRGTLSSASGPKQGGLERYNFDFGIDEQAVSNYQKKGQHPPNCIGYTLYTLGLKSEEMNIDTISPELETMVQERFDRVSSDDRIIREYAHMAVVDKQQPGVVTERPFSDGRVRKSTIEHVWKMYPPRLYGSPAEYVYLKVKPLPSTQTT